MCLLGWGWGVALLVPFLRLSNGALLDIYIYLLQLSYGIDCKYKTGICMVFMDIYRCIFKINFCWSVHHMIIYYYHLENLQILTRPILCCFLRGNLGCHFPGLQTLTVLAMVLESWWISWPKLTTNDVVNNSMSIWFVVFLYICTH